MSKKHYIIFLVTAFFFIYVTSVEKKQKEEPVLESSKTHIVNNSRSDVLHKNNSNIPLSIDPTNQKNDLSQVNTSAVNNLAYDESWKTYKDYEKLQYLLHEMERFMHNEITQKVFDENNKLKKIFWNDPNYEFLASIEFNENQLYSLLIRKMILQIQI